MVSIILFCPAWPATRDESSSFCFFMRRICLMSSTTSGSRSVFFRMSSNWRTLSARSGRPLARAKASASDSVCLINGSLSTESKSLLMRSKMSITCRSTLLSSLTRPSCPSVLSVFSSTVDGFCAESGSRDGVLSPIPSFVTGGINWEAAEFVLLLASSLVSC